MAENGQGSWAIQRNRHRGRWYYQAVWNGGDKRTTFGLGYLSDEEADLARSGVHILKPPHKLVFVAQDGGGKPPVPSRASIGMAVKTLLLDLDAREVMQDYENRARDDARKRVALGDYSLLTLRQFYDEVWTTVRAGEVAESTWRGERDLWPQMLEALGDLRLADLNTARWTAFLTGQDNWSPRTRVLAQNAYRQLLKYASQVNAIDTVHEFRRIRGTSKPSREPAEPLTAEEVPRVLAAAPSVMHRAMFGFAIGLGLRPGEVTALRWEDVDWPKKLVRIRGSKTATSDAVLPLLPLAEENLRPWWVEKRRPSSGLAFMWLRKRIGSYRSAWRTACVKAGVTRRTYPYLSRHTFATLAAAAGAPQASVRAVLRHSKHSTILEEAYQRLNTEQVRNSLASFPGS